MIPFIAYRPEGLPSLRRRFSLAVNHIHDVELMMLGVRPFPASEPEHVFDFPDGFRLIVSRDRMPGGAIIPGATWIHVSASVAPGSRIDRTMARKRAAKEWFAELAAMRYSLLSGDREPLFLQGFSAEKGVPHLYRRESEGGAR